MSSVPDRSDVAEEYTWDLSDLYADDEEWEAAFEAVEERLECGLPLLVVGIEVREVPGVLLGDVAPVGNRTHGRW